MVSFSLSFIVSVRHVRIPRQKEEVTIIPKFVLSVNKICVQIFERASLKEFENMQFDTLQKIQLKEVENPGMKMFFG